MGGLNRRDRTILRLVLKGRSVIDSPGLQFQTDEEVHEFLRVNEFDTTRPKDLERLQDVHNQAIDYLKRELRYEVAPEIRDPSRIPSLFRTASDPSNGELRRQACSVLKTMNIINHVDGRELLYNCPISLRDTFSLAEDKIERALSSLSLSDPTLLRYKGGRKPKESVITKLLGKRETIAAQVYDRVRYRIVTRRLEDIPTVILHLFRTVLPFNYLIPGASVNQLLPVDARDRIVEALKRLKRKFASSSRTMEYSGRNYRVCKFVVDIPVRMESFLAQSGGTLYRDSLGTIGYVLVEFQIVDEETDAANNTGESSHENYKGRQKRGVLRRLTGK